MHDNSETLFLATKRVDWLKMVQSQQKYCKMQLLRETLSNRFLQYHSHSTKICT